MDTQGSQSPSTLTSGVPAQSGRLLPDENAAPAAPPTCYRHTGRECHVRCTRCDRFICPSCMLSAAVGFQCPDCVRTGHEAAREARTVFGGRIGNGAPVVSLLLVVINLAVFVAELKVPALADRLSMAGRNIVLANGYKVPLPVDFPFLPPGTHLTGVAAGEWYRLLTAAFVHPLPSSVGPFAFAQLICNLAWLWKLGPQLEEQLGRTRYLALYLLCAVGGSVAVYILSPEQALLGASPAILGLLAAYYAMNRSLRRNPLGSLGLLSVCLAWWLLMAVLRSWQAHLGGLLVGAAVGLVFGFAPRGRHRAWWQASGVGVVAGILVLLVVWQTGQSVWL